MEGLENSTGPSNLAGLKPRMLSISFHGRPGEMERIKRAEKWNPNRKWEGLPSVLALPENSQSG
jgi:hypothetical protein